MENFDTIKKLIVTKISYVFVIFVQMVTLLGTWDYFLLQFKLSLGGNFFDAASCLLCLMVIFGELYKDVLDQELEQVPHLHADMENVRNFTQA